MKRAALALTLLGCVSSAAARSFPDELVKPLYTEIAKACGKKDPANAKRYVAGFNAVMARHPEWANAVVPKEFFSDLDERIKADVAKMPEEEFLKNCNGLLEFAQKAEAKPDQKKAR
jgi:hypothetical protein